MAPLPGLFRQALSLLIPRLYWSSPGLLSMDPPDCAYHLSAALFYDYHVPSAFVRVWRSSAMRVPAAPPSPRRRGRESPSSLVIAFHAP